MAAMEEGHEGGAARVQPFLREHGRGEPGGDVEAAIEMNPSTTPSSSQKTHESFVASGEAPSVREPSVRSVQSLAPAIMSQSRIVYACLVIPLAMFIVYCRGNVNGMGGNDLTYTLMLFGAICLFPKLPAEPKETTPAALRTAAPAVPLRQVDSAARPPAVRLYYLDNLKIFMTFLVLFHHISISFGSSGGVAGYIVGNFDSWFFHITTAIVATNQSFFMCLFFFISGYFTPASLAKKGVREFVRDKFMRLGLPLFAFFLVINPVLYYFMGTVVLGMEYPTNTWTVGLGPPWFLQVLLLFNSAYVLIRGVTDVPAVKCPTPGQITLAGLVIGLVQGWFILNGFTLWGMPLAQGSMPFDIAFFIAGCLAKKNRWLEDFQEMMPPGSTTARMVLGGTLAVVLLLGAVFLSVPGPAHLNCTPLLAHQTTLTAAADSTNWLQNLLQTVIFQGLFFGLETVLISMSLVHLFSQYLNFSNSLTKFLSEGAYGVSYLQIVHGGHLER
eukprot:TRINITY_DN4884_c0_g1_i2.p1 TRINITY_DN4884_c0_g1~~TRINITY_DN4884_c0_g1_i2.p1  ORF type:complete len:500 (-),score=49.50 TRINITY_DN4884_c0_g1_i2:523-2022(-)